MLISTNLSYVVKKDVAVLTACKTRLSPSLGTSSDSVKYGIDLSDYSKLSIEKPAINSEGNLS